MQFSKQQFDMKLAGTQDVEVYCTLAIIVVTIACCMVNPGGGKEAKQHQPLWTIATP